MATTTLGFPYPASTDPPAGHTQIQALATAVDAQPGIGSFTQTQINAFAAGDKRAGRIVWNSTTSSLQRCDGSTWVDLVITTAMQSFLVSETVTDLTIAANLTALDLSVGNVGYIATAPAANFTLNLTNAPTTNGKAITVTLAVVQGATGFIPSALQVAGSAQTIKWQGGSAPTPTNGAGKIDMFSFTLIRRGSAWTVLGSALVNF